MAGQASARPWQRLLVAVAGAAGEAEGGGVPVAGLAGLAAQEALIARPARDGRTNPECADDQGATFRLWQPAHQPKR